MLFEGHEGMTGVIHKNSILRASQNKAAPRRRIQQIESGTTSLAAPRGQTSNKKYEAVVVDATIFLKPRAKRTLT